MSVPYFKVDNGTCLFDSGSDVAGYLIIDLINSNEGIAVDKGKIKLISGGKKE